MLTEHNPDLHLRIGREELVIRQRYQVISIANDVLIGSVEMLIRPVIRLIRHLHLQRLRSPAAAGDDSFDY